MRTSILFFKNLKFYLAQNTINNSAILLWTDMKGFVHVYEKEIANHLQYMNRAIFRQGSFKN